MYHGTDFFKKIIPARRQFVKDGKENVNSLTYYFKIKLTFIVDISVFSYISMVGISTQRKTKRYRMGFVAGFRLMTV
jgi:hypothetical protein